MFDIGASIRALPGLGQHLNGLQDRGELRWRWMLPGDGVEGVIAKLIPVRQSSGRIEANASPTKHERLLVLK
jgi:hypothetical protein